MKIENRGPSHKSSVSSENFTVSQDDASFVFHLLLQQLYSDPKRVAVQELAANAADAHVKAGKEDEPFHVSLPEKREKNREPHKWTRASDQSTPATFSIRDYGVAMSPEKIKNIYTSMGASDKRDSNDFTGAFGIGGKTPLAFRDEFFLESIIDGVRHQYVIHRSEDGMPSYSKLSEEETDAPRGVRVSFVVEENIRRFNKKAKKVLSFFDPSPKGVSTDTRNYSVKGDGWGALDSPSYGSQELAIMGNIAYPIEKEYQDNRFTSVIHLFFDTGDLTVTSDREGLQYDDKTVQALEDAYESAYQERLDMIRQDLEDVRDACPWEQSWEIQKYQERCIKRPAKISEGIKEKFDTPLRYKEYQEGDEESGSIKSADSQHPPPFYVIDKAHKHWVKIKHNLDAPNDRFIYTRDEDKADDICEILGYDTPTGYTSELEAPSRDKKTTSTRSSSSPRADADMLRLTETQRRNNRPHWELIHNMPEKAFYVHLSRYKWGIEKGDNPNKPHGLVSLRDILNDMLGTDYPVIGVKKRGWADIADDWCAFKTFQPLFDAMVPYLGAANNMSYHGDVKFFFRDNPNAEVIAEEATEAQHLEVLSLMYHLDHECEMALARTDEEGHVTIKLSRRKSHYDYVIGNNTDEVKEVKRKANKELRTIYEKYPMTKPSLDSVDVRNYLRE